MRLHQVITGSRNKGHNSISFLNFSGSLYIVYGRGGNIVVLDRDLFQVQLIPDAAGADSGEITCICCENLTGLIAVSDGKSIMVFETAGAHASKTAWKEFSHLCPGSMVTALAWFPHSSICKKPLLLIGSSSPSTSVDAHYYISGWQITWPCVGEKERSFDAWQRLWTVESNGQIECLRVSPDGRFIAAQCKEPSSKHEEEVLSTKPFQVQIWCQTPMLDQSSGSSGGLSATNWVPSNLRHPKEIVAFSWRSMPRYLPPGWLSNALLTICADGVARVWVESSVGSHRTSDSHHQSDSSPYLSYHNSSSTRLLPSILLNHPVLRYYFRLWLTLPANACRADVISGSDLPFQLHEPMKGNKFVLAASINVTDSNLSILSPNYDDLSHKGPCSLQWMNNKTIDVERKLDRLLQHLILLISSTPIGDSITEHGLDKFRPQIGILDQMLLRCLSKWRRMHDTLLMLHPSDGSLFLWSINGLDCSTLNGSMLCSFAHKFCDGSVCADGLTNRARDAIEADITQNRRVCQTSFSLRSRLPGTDFSHVTPVAVHNSLLFTCVFENGSVTTMQSHMLLIDCFMARSKLALAVSSKLSSSVRNRYLQDIRGVQLACTTAPELRGPLILDLYSSAALDGSTLKHQEVGCSALMQPSDSFDVICTTSKTISQADGHDEAVLSMAYHPMLPLVLTLSASEFIVWRSPFCSPGPLSAPLSPPLRHFGRYRQDGTSLRYAAFFPCFIAPLHAPSSATNNTLPLSVIAVDSSTEIQLFSVDTTGTVTKIGNLTPTMDASLSSSSSMLLVISAPSSSSSFLVIKIFSTVEHNTGSLCRIETWRVDLDSKQVINGHATTTEALQARYRSSSLSPSSIIAGSSKISDHVLPLEPGVTVTCIKQGPSPISWCNEVLRPSYLIATTCSDGGIRLWTAEAIKSNCKKSPTTNFLIKWVEWRLPFAEFSHSRIFIPSDLLAQRRSLDELHKSARNRVCLSSPRRIPIGSQHNARAFVVACATNWRIAIGCAMGQTDPLMIVILECESSGGLEWMLEDIVIPSVELCPCHITSSEMQSIQLDWVKTEDGGSMLLSFLCNQTLLIFSAQCFDVIAATRAPHLHTSSTLLTSLGEVGLRWNCLRQVDLLVDTSKSPIFPLLWLPNGLLMFHHSCHIYLFSQWPSNDSVIEANQIPTQSQQVKNGKSVDPSLLSSSDAAKMAFGSMSATRLKSVYSNLHLTTIRSRSALQSFQTGRKSEHFNHTFFNGLGLFEAAQLSNPILPQFHPRQLLEWMNLGRFRLVQALLVHLTRCLSAVDVVCGLDAARPKTTVNNSSRHQRTRSISLAISGGIIDASLETSSLTTPSSSPELEIPPLPLHILLALDSLSFQHLVANSSNTTFDNFAPLSENSGSLLNEDLATELNDEETSVQIDGGSDTAQRGSWRVSLETLGYLSNGLPSNPLWDLNNHQTLASLLKFDNQEARILSDLLSRYRLPGLSRLDQMYLLGIAELMANTRTEVTDRLSGIVATAPQTPPNFKEHDQSNFPAASELELDDCGLRFVMIMQLYSYLCGTIPLVKRSQMMKEGLTSRSFVWAFHSGADEVLLSFLPSQKQQHHQSDPTSKTSGGLTWAEFRRYGCGWWIHSDVILMQCAEKMARSEFLRTKDPMDSAIFYLAMHKPTVMASLFKSLGNRPLENFFRSDFTLGSPACKQAKLNAFRLLSQHKYVQAAALFLVGGWLEDAIKVCVDSVKDLQLAVVVCRLYSLSRTEFNESSISPYHKLLRTHVISHEDPYLRSIAYWVLMEPLNALTTLLQKPSAQIMDTPLPSQCPTMFPSGFDFEVCPSVFKLYTYIRSHPLVARHLRLTDEGDRIQSQLRLLDRRLYFRTAYHYNTIGCPTLTLEVLSRLPHLSPSDAVSNNLRKSDLSVSESQNLNEEVQLSFFKPNEDVRALVGEGDFEVVWSDEEEEAKRSDFTEVTDSLSQPSSAIESNILQHGDTSGNLDNAASHEPSIHLQMEYWACLRIFTEELCGMFSTASAEGGRLKKHIFTWIENGIAILQKISFPYKESYLDGVQYSFHVPFDRDNKEQSLFIPIDYHGSRHLDGFVLSSIIEKEQSMTSHLPAQTDQQEMCDNRFYFCLLSNLEFVQSLITFCSLHGESGVDLRVVRMELTYLLMDVFSSVFERSDFSSQSRFLRSLPLLKCVRPTAFPGFMSLISRPLDLIKTLINDINASLVHLAPPYLRFIRTLPSCSTKELHSVVMADGSSVVRRVGLLRNLCMTLSAYVFQCLSTGTWRASHQGNAGLAIAVTQSAFKSSGRFSECQKPLFPNSEPSDWPGLPGLFVSAGCAQPTSSQHSLLGVLAEAMVAVYMGLCVCALYARDSCALYRLAWNARLAESLTWSRVFGGVCRLKPLRPPAPPTRPSSTFSSPAPQPKKRGSFASSMQSPNSATQMGSFHFQVDQIAPVVTKIYLAQPSTHADEWFLPPQCSMMTCFLNKPRLSEKTFSEATFVYDSEDSSPPSDYDDYETATKYFRNKQRWTRLRTSGDSAVPLSSDSSTDSESTDISEDPGHVILLPGCDLKVVHLNPDFGIAGFGNIPDAFSLTAIGSHKDNSDVSSEVDDFERIAPVDKQWSDGYSYAWRLMRLAFVQLMTQQLTGLIKLLNLDNDFLTTYAPSLLQSKGLLDRWIIGYTEDLTFDCDKDNELDLGIPINHPPEKGVYNGDFGAPPGATLDDSSESALPPSTRRAMAEMAHLLNPSISPFQTRNPFSLPVKRLWFCLMSKPGLSETFMRWIYHPRHSVRPSVKPIKLQVSRRSSSNANVPAPLSPSARKSDPASKLSTNSKETEPHIGEAGGIERSTSTPAQHEFSINLIHREMEPLLCMCVDRVGYQYVALATPKQLIEISISNLLSSADWLFDDFEYDLESMRNPHLKSHCRASASDFIICEKTPLDLADQTHEPYEAGSQDLRGLNSQLFRGLINTPAANLSEHILEFSRRVAPTVLRRSVSGVQKLSAHPLVPFYLCGTASGSVHVLQWNSEEPVVPMLTNTFAFTPQGLNIPISTGVRGNPVSVLHIDTSGKRFGCGDTTGNFGLWNLDFNGSNSHPYFNCRSHGKGVLDFAFLEGSSMTFATVGVGGAPPFTTGSATGSGPTVTSTATRTGQRILTQSELEAANLIIWDALLPSSRAAVMAFAESPLDTACTCVAGIPSGSNERQLAVGTKRGEVAILDLRRRPAATLFNPSAHEGSALRSISCDSATNTLVTAGADGLVKVWRLSDPRRLLATFRSDGFGSHGSRAAATASIAAAALFRGNQSAAVAAASRPGISEVVSLPLTSIASVASETESLQLLTTRFLACGVDGCLQLCSVTPRPEPIWLSK
uniref:DmX protein 1 n=1 Tax=Echinococcus granulosus TaxID=6210 RepID=A0A068WQY9_ECHGR|nr:dmX protein 1 [Echinococcus granulosus]